MLENVSGCMNKTFGYTKKMIYNEPNSMMLYGVDYTSELRDACIVFMSKEDAESWIDHVQDEDDKYLGYHACFNPEKEFSKQTEILYHYATILLIKQREVWIG